LDPLEHIKVLTDENGTTYVYGPLDPSKCPSTIHPDNNKLFYFTQKTEDGVQSWWATDSKGQDRIECKL
jgi:hypothetical protein